jgi:uncharacterized membrane protein
MDTSILAIWIFLISFGLTGLAASVIGISFPQELIINLVSSGFLLLSAIRLLHWRGRTGFIVPVACAMCALIIQVATKQRYIPYPSIGMFAASILNGMVISVFAALVPTFDDCWQRVKPYPRTIKFSK